MRNRFQHYEYDISITPAVMRLWLACSTWRYINLFHWFRSNTQRISAVTTNNFKNMQSKTASSMYPNELFHVDFSGYDLLFRIFNFQLNDIQVGKSIECDCDIVAKARDVSQQIAHQSLYTWQDHETTRSACETVASWHMAHGAGREAHRKF